MTESSPPPPLDPVAETPLTYEQRRNRRQREVRARTVNVTRLPQREIDLGRLLYPDGEPLPPRPVTRADCVDGIRPCPYVGCRFALYLDVAPKTGSIKLNFPDLEPHELAESCALDVADAGGATLVEVGALMNVTRERIRQLEVQALARMARAGAATKLREHAEESEEGHRRLPVLQGGSR